MQSPFNDKLGYGYPCKPSQTCVDYEDYDPCESSEDITEKDLVVLLKEEAAKLEREKKKAQATAAESDKIGKDDKSFDKTNFTQEEEESGAKKKSCKFPKNPFFTNRLKLSTSHLPLPPPGPPPQNFPLATDESRTKICPRKKKKCKKNDKTRKPSGTSVKDEDEGDLYGDGARDLDEDTCKYEDVSKFEDTSKDQGKDHKKGAGKKSCKKRIEEKLPPCKKKESEESIIFQPRQIPFQQKDLPETSPKDIPEVERQIAFAKNEEDDFKKKCKTKDQVK